MGGTVTGRTIEQAVIPREVFGSHPMGAPRHTHSGARLRIAFRRRLGVVTNVSNREAIGKKWQAT